MIASPALREREGPSPQGWEGEGLIKFGSTATPSPGSLSLATLSRDAGEGAYPNLHHSPAIA